MDAGYAWIVFAGLLFIWRPWPRPLAPALPPVPVWKTWPKSSVLPRWRMVGAAIWICQQAQAGSWGLSAVTLMAMVLTAVVDFRKLHDSRTPRIHSPAVPAGFRT